MEVAQSLTEGERWTVEALTELRADGYRPGAWAQFVGASLARSARTRRARSELAAQTRRWAALGAVAWLLACRLAARRQSIRLRRGAGLVWWLAACKMLDWHLGMAESDDGVRRERLSSADAATMSRFWLVPALIGSRRGLAAAIVVGGLTDWLDGALARRDGHSRLGRDLDTTADLAFFAAQLRPPRTRGAYRASPRRRCAHGTRPASCSPSRPRSGASAVPRSRSVRPEPCSESAA